MELSLTKLPWYGQIGAFVVLGLAAGGAFYYYYEGPVRADIEIRESQLAALRRDVQMGQATAKKLPEFQAEVGRLQARLDNLKAVLPDAKDAADLLRRLQTVATQSSLTIKGFKPQATATKQLHAEWPIDLELEGTYHNLAIFFDRVSKFTRIVNINALAIKAQQQPKPNSTISATCVATTFVLLDQAAVAKPGDAAAKGTS
jgi:type IV pilus assembly protein PilO